MTDASIISLLIAGLAMIVVYLGVVLLTPSLRADLFGAIGWIYYQIVQWWDAEVAAYKTPETNVPTSDVTYYSDHTKRMQKRSEENIELSRYITG